MTIPKILFITRRAELPSFIAEDLAILKRHFETLHLPVKEKNQGGIKFFRELKSFFRTIRKCRRGGFNLLFIWFPIPGFTAFLMFAAGLMGVKTVVVCGGDDITSMPEIGFGKMRMPKKRIFLKYIYTHAHLIIPFSRYSEQELKKWASPRRIQVIYPGVDLDAFAPGLEPRENLAVTVGTLNDLTLVQKGIGTFIDSAAHLPQLDFEVAGAYVPETLNRLKPLAGANVRFRGRLSFEELKALYRKARVYVQVSAQEGFGVAVAEAMASGCVPVVTNRTALPEVVGDVGFFAEYGDPRSTAAAIELAMQHGDGEAARRRVVENFDIAFRERKLCAALAELTGGPDRQTRVHAGCGPVRRSGYINFDLRPTTATDLCADICGLPFKDSSVAELLAEVVLEHLPNPFAALDEIHRVLKPGGKLVCDMPNLGTVSAHADPTHAFLVDLKTWKDILGGYFERVAVRPIGLKYRDNGLLRVLNGFAVKVLRFYELTQGWRFTCEAKRPETSRNFNAWWL